MDGVGAESGAALHGLGAGAKDATMELLDVLFGWIVPLIMILVGYVMSTAIGLSGAIGTLLDGVLGGIASVATWLPHIASAIAALIWGVIGGAMWSVAGMPGKPSTSGNSHKYIGYVLRPIAGLFVGFALGEVPGAFSGHVLNGALGKLAGAAA